jgi:hypothetical protein
VRETDDVRNLSTLIHALRIAMVGEGLVRAVRGLATGPRSRSGGAP